MTNDRQAFFNAIFFYPEVPILVVKFSKLILITKFTCIIEKKMNAKY